jgi:outer membrane protein OmpA-like peptidoglycan-associated protein
MAVVGIAVAQLYPAQSQEPPLVEVWLQRAQLMLDTGLNRIGIMRLSEAQTQAQIQAETTAAPNIAPASALPAAERQNLQVELTQLQAELQALTSQSSQPLTARVQPLQKRIQTIQSQLSSFTAARDPGLTASTGEVESAPQPELLVTFPSDALFADGAATLRPGSEAILSSIVSDLQQYPAASIQISAYTDRQKSPELDRERSLEQAKAVRHYLSQQLGGDLHWVSIGQGQNQPLAPNDSAENQQRNRRIEIAIQAN